MQNAAESAWDASIESKENSALNFALFAGVRVTERPVTVLPCSARQSQTTIGKHRIEFPHDDDHLEPPIYRHPWWIGLDLNRHLGLAGSTAKRKPRTTDHPASTAWVMSVSEAGGDSRRSVR